MNLLTSWHSGSRRFACALAVTSTLLVASESFGQRFATRTIRVDTGIAPTPVPVGAVHTLTMPVAAQSSSFTALPPQTHNLGTFKIQINPSPALAANLPALAAFQRAAELWEARISDPITVVVDADIAPLGAGILGQAGSELLSASYTTIRNAMVNDAANEGVDDAIVGALPTAANYNVTLPAGFGLDGFVFASKANLKALGFDPNQLDTAAGTTDDVHITFSSTFAFDYDKSDGITAGQYDFEGVAAHEIGHGLGFFSGVDDVDFVQQPGLPNPGPIIEPTPLDMFRYRDNVAQDPATVADFSNGTLAFPRNMVPGHVAMFDQILPNQGGSSVEVLFSTGVSFGDGNQASHWKDGLGLGLMDPTASPGQILSLHPNDFRAMDLIGYEILMVPEASSLILFAIGAAVSVSMRRRSAG